MRKAAQDAEKAHQEQLLIIREDAQDAQKTHQEKVRKMEKWLQDAEEAYENVRVEKIRYWGKICHLRKEVKRLEEALQNAQNVPAKGTY